MPKYKTIILVNGCFWHGHNCKIGSGSRTPKSNSKYWSKKISKNIERDKKNRELLNKEGWKIITIWECEINDKEIINNKLMPLFRAKEDALQLNQIGDV